VDDLRVTSQDPGCKGYISTYSFLRRWLALSYRCHLAVAAANSVYGSGRIIIIHILGLGLCRLSIYITALIMLEVRISVCAASTFPNVFKFLCTTICFIVVSC
jgi:hypothetical protein